MTGQVEREARQLVEAAARWLSAVPDDDEYAARTVDLEADAEASAGFGAAGVSARAQQHTADEQVQEHAADEQVADGASEHSEEHVCRGCPWCRAKAAAGPIGADTLDSLAHLLSTAAESLSLFAQSRREASNESEGESDAPQDVDDAVVDWDDEDEDEFRAGEDEPTQSPTKETRSSPRPRRAR